VRSWPVLAGTLALFLAATGSPAGGDDAHAEQEDPDAVHRAEEIVVEGEGEPPSHVYEETPVEREVLDRAEIEQRPATSAADLVRVLPGFRSQQRVQGEESAVSIEGLPPEQTRALVDGRRYEGEIGGVDDFQRLPLADAERVEVLRGVQALRYGSEAAGGVVRIETPDPPRDGLRSWLDAGAGDQGRIYGSGSLGYGDERAGGWLRFVHDQIDGFDAPHDLEDGVLVSAGSQSRRVSRDVYGKLRFAVQPGLELATRLGWRLDDERDLTVAGEGERGDRDEERWLAAQEFAWDLGERGLLSGSLAGYDDTLTSDVGRPFTMEEDELAGDLTFERLVHTGSVAHALTLGVDGSAPRLDLDESTGPPGPEAGGDVYESILTGGLFALSETQLLDSLAFEAGVRGQLHSELQPQLLPQLAVLWSPWRSDAQRFLRLRASWGLGWRPPSLRDLYQPAVPQLGGAYFLEGDPDLEPEHVETIRLGAELAPLENLSFAVTGFHNRMRDLIRSRPAGSIQTGTETVTVCRPICVPVEVPILAPLYRKENLSRVHTEGAELRGRWRPHRLVDFELAYTYLHTSVSDPDTTLSELPNEPEHVVDAIASFEVPVWRTRLTAQARWRGEALTETSGTGLPGFGSFEESDPSLIVDLRVAQPIGRGFEAYVDVFNVGDERVVDSYVVRGRSFLVGLRARWD
jgi:outer membrane receptor for ferrienterochelin and colicins